MKRTNAVVSPLILGLILVTGLQSSGSATTGAAASGCFYEEGGDLYRKDIPEQCVEEGDTDCGPIARGVKRVTSGNSSGPALAYFILKEAVDQDENRVRNILTAIVPDGTNRSGDFNQFGCPQFAVAPVSLLDNVRKYGITPKNLSTGGDAWALLALTTNGDAWVWQASDINNFYGTSRGGVTVSYAPGYNDPCTGSPSSFEDFAFLLTADCKGRPGIAVLRPRGGCRGNAGAGVLDPRLPYAEGGIVSGTSVRTAARGCR